MDTKFCINISKIQADETVLYKNCQEMYSSTLDKMEREF